jgi:hypothetical protein
LVRINDWVKDLKIDESSLRTNFRRLSGNNKLIQAENDNYTVTLSKKLIPLIETIGVTNRCNDGLFVLFADYDKVYRELVYKNIKNLLTLFPGQLSNFFIACTEPETKDNYGQTIGSYHVINLAKGFKSEIKNYLKYMDVDKHYKSIPLKTPHKCHVLRITKKVWRENNKTLKEKPFFLEMFPNEFVETGREQSTAHYSIFSKEWKFKDLYFSQRQWDNQKNIELQKYSTPKKNNA